MTPAPNLGSVNSSVTIAETVAASIAPIRSTGFKIPIEIGAGGTISASSALVGIPQPIPPRVRPLIKRALTMKLRLYLG